METKKIFNKINSIKSLNVSDLTSEVNLYNVIIFQDLAIRQMEYYKASSLFDKKWMVELSPLEQKVNKFFYENNNKINEQLAANVLKKHKKTYKDDDYYKYLDIEVEHLFAEKRKKLTKAVLREEVYFYLLDRKLLEENSSSFKINKEITNFLKNKNNYKTFLRKITKSSRRYYYVRNLENQIGFLGTNKITELEPWTQLLIAKKNKEIKIASIKSTTYSKHEKKEDFELYLKVAEGKIPVKTIIVNINAQGIVKELELKELVLVDNYKWEEYKNNILSAVKIIKNPDELSWDYFLQTGENWNENR